MFSQEIYLQYKLRNQIIMNKPFYLGLSKFGLRKTKMYEFGKGLTLQVLNQIDHFPKEKIKSNWFNER